MLRDVLLCPPDNFRWLPTSAISKATLESGAVFDAELARAQHRELVSAYEGAGVEVHFLEPDPALPYQVFARDSSVMTPAGVVVTQLKQRWRRGEYAPVIRFYQSSGIPIRGMITRRGDRGRRRDDRRARRDADRKRRGANRDRGRSPARRRGSRPTAGRCGSSRSPASSSTSTCSSRSWPRSSPPSASRRRPAGWSRWLRAKGFEILEVSLADAFKLGVNAISLGGERVISTAGSAGLNEQMRSLGLEVLDPDLSMFTLGGGGAHCLAQALRRDPVGLSVAAAPAIDAARVIADLRELARRTGDEPRRATGVLGPRPGATPGSCSASCSPRSGSRPSGTRRGTSGRDSRAPTPTAPALAVGSHLDSVPDGGWLDGALGRDGAARRAARLGRAGASHRPGRSLLVDWADEEGARFGRSLFGSSAFSGTLDPADVARPARRRRSHARRRAGRERRRARAGRARRGARRDARRRLPRAPHRAGAGARGGGPSGRRGRRLRRGRARIGCASAARRRTPARRRWSCRRDAGLAAAEAALAVERIARRARRRRRRPGRCASSPGSPPPSPATPSSSSTCATPTPRQLAAMLEEALAGRRAAPRTRAAAGSRTSRSGGSSRSRSTPSSSPSPRDACRGRRAAAPTR